MQKRTWIGVIGSAVFHGALATAIFAGFSPQESANSYAGELSTNISMEMIMSMTVEDVAPEPPPAPEPEVETKPEPQPTAEAISDPTIKEKPKKKEKPKEKPKDKPKVEPKKEQPKEKSKDHQSRRNQNKPRPDAVRGDREIQGNNNSVNAKATSTGNVNSNNPNLAGSGTSTAEQDAYLSKARREIERHKKYSNRAKMQRKQGTVTIAFNINADGSFSNARVVKSSGSEDLDKSALEAVRSARSIGTPPARVAKSISVPISFKLQ